MNNDFSIVNGSNEPLSINLASQCEMLLDDMLHYYPNAFAPKCADALLNALLEEVPWQTSQVHIYGKTHSIPRLESWHGDANAQYRYSGKILAPKPWTKTLLQLKDLLNDRFNTRLNSVLCNLYRDGNDHMGWHSDDEPELGPAPRILSLSLGAERDFALRKRGDGKQWGKLPLSHGSLLDMRPPMQSYWQHSVPTRKKLNGARINLTFREIQTSRY